jgi:hypothetical protein
MNTLCEVFYKSYTTSEMDSDHQKQDWRLA